MKNIYIILVSLLFTACGAYKSLDLDRLTTGMTKQEVQFLIGSPDRILAVNNNKDGFQEVLEYRTARHEVYALEFWNDYLTGYEFLYDDVNYMPPLMPPLIFPEYGRPIFIYPDYHHPNRPNHPNRPDKPNRPSRPSQSNRPSSPNGSNRPSRPSESQPSQSTRPSGPETSRPSLTKPAESTRPTPRPSSGSNRSSKSESNSTNSRSGVTKKSE